MWPTPRPHPTTRPPKYPPHPPSNKKLCVHGEERARMALAESCHAALEGAPEERLRRSGSASSSLPSPFRSRPCRSSAVRPASTLLERFDIEPFPDFSAKLSNFTGLVLFCMQILQINIRWKALRLDEIYKIYMLLHRSDLNISANCVKRFRIFQKNAIFNVFHRISRRF